MVVRFALILICFLWNKGFGQKVPTELSSVPIINLHGRVSDSIYVDSGIGTARIFSADTSGTLGFDFPQLLVNFVCASVEVYKSADVYNNGRRPNEFQLHYPKYISYTDSVFFFHVQLITPFKPGFVTYIWMPAARIMKPLSLGYRNKKIPFKESIPFYGNSYQINGRFGR